jgi:N-acetylmuramoyl-L-alanine amidase
MTSMLRAGLVLASLIAAPALAEERPAVASTPLPSVPAVAPLPALPVDATVTAVPRTSFASLAQAVAAQDGATDDEHLRCLASAVYFESQGEPLAGQLAVAQVILNRMRSGRYADTPCGVIRQRGQFGFVRGGVIPSVDSSRSAFRTAVAVARVALTGAWEHRATAGALFFNGVRAARVGTRRIATIGNHAFYR